MTPPLRLACLVLCGIPSVSAFAQENPYGRKQPNVQWERVELEGTLKQAGGGELVMQTASNETWRVQVSAPRKDISFTAEADESFLKKGMYVQFVTRLNKRGYAQEPVKALMITTPDVANPPSEAIPAGPNLGADLFSSVKPEAETKKKGPKKPAPKPVAPKPEETDVQVGGVITSIKNGKMIIASDGDSVHADLADDAKLTVNMADLSWVRAGDKVEITGRMVKDRKGLAQAYSVSVAAKEPLIDEAKRKLLAKQAAATEDDKKDDEKTPKPELKKAE